jgi:hypothetical protein
MPLRVTTWKVGEADSDEPAEQWVNYCLALAYLPADAPAEQFVEALSLVRDTKALGAQIAGEAKTLARSIRAVVESYPLRLRRRTVRLKLVARDVREVFIERPCLAVDEHGDALLRVGFLPLSSPAVLLLLHLFLPDRNLKIGTRLRACALPGCGRTFISKAAVGGGPKPKYCSREHQQKADRLLARKRVAKYRSKP